MSDTPETDEQINGKPCTSFFVCAGDTLRDALVPSEFARKLERERDEARIQVKLLRVENNHNWQANDLAEQAFRERDEAREALKRITECDMRWSKKIARDALEGAK
jgi:hypothetical protein